MPRVFVKSLQAAGRWRGGIQHPMEGHEIDVSDEQLAALKGDALLEVGGPGGKQAPGVPGKPTSLNQAELHDIEVKKAEAAKAAVDAQVRNTEQQASELQQMPAPAPVPEASPAVHEQHSKHQNRR